MYRGTSTRAQLVQANAMNTDCCAGGATSITAHNVQTRENTVQVLTNNRFNKVISNHQYE
jgi:hypothetical protein